jgi:Protein of unknown function (DUF3667)
MTAWNDSTTTCRNCGAETIDKYCHACGQKSYTSRLTLGYFLHEIPHAVFHVDRGFGATLKGLATRPGETINHYLDGKRAQFFNPLTLMVIIAGISAFMFSALTFNFSIPETGVTPIYLEKYQRFMQLNFRYYTPTLVLYLPVMAAITWLVFLRNRKTYGEHLAINAFVLAFMGAIMLILFPLVFWADQASALTNGFIVLFIITTLYQWWAWYRVFQIPGCRLSTLFRSILAIVIYLALALLIPAAFFFLVYVRWF